jgi:hypothetical protein
MKEYRVERRYRIAIHEDLFVLIQALSENAAQVEVQALGLCFDSSIVEFVAL